MSVLLDLAKEAAIVGLSQSAATTDDGACFLDVEAIASMFPKFGVGVMIGAKGGLAPCRA